MPKSVSDARPVGRLLAVATLAAAPFVLLRALTGMAWWDDEGALLAGFRSPHVRRNLFVVRALIQWRVWARVRRLARPVDAHRGPVDRRGAVGCLYGGLRGVLSPADGIGRDDTVWLRACPV